jgi:hypothetical protein
MLVKQIVTWECRHILCLGIDTTLSLSQGIGGNFLKW